MNMQISGLERNDVQKKGESILTPATRRGSAEQSLEHKRTGLAVSFLALTGSSEQIFSSLFGCKCLLL